MKKRKGYYLLSGILAFIVFINLFFYFVSPKQIVSAVGVENTYLVVFIIAAVGGLSTLTGAALLASIAAFAAGGAEPLPLSLAGGAGIFISDSIFYFLALYGHGALPENWGRSLERVRKWVEKHPPWMVLSAAYVYISFTPFPNDLLMIGLVIGGYSYKKIAWILLLGSLTVAAITAYFGDAILNRL